MNQTLSELLQRGGLLNDDNTTALDQNFQYAEELHLVLKKLQKAGILTQANFDLLVQNAPHADKLDEVLFWLSVDDALTKANFEALVKYSWVLDVLLEELIESPFNQAKFDASLEKMRLAGSAKTPILNWQRVAVVTAFCRANKGHHFQDSILPLVSCITYFSTGVGRPFKNEERGSADAPPAVAAAATVAAARPK
jgi:hypothetical protein